MNNRLSVIINSTSLLAVTPNGFSKDNGSLKDCRSEKIANICKLLRGAVTHKFDGNTVFAE